MTKPQTTGRPRLDDADPSVPVTFRLPSREFAALCSRATRAEVSVGEIIRRELRGQKEHKTQG